ncbi:hypothetical protein BD770DRAFT_395863 [Pilaira anomala]|nr:hypothetical protein BD770DRAFT_395863 [Pilaira anomala]
MDEAKLTERLEQERVTTRLQKREIEKLESQNSKLQRKLLELKQQLQRREQEIEEEERDIQKREAQVKEDYESIKASLHGNINTSKEREIDKLKEEKTDLLDDVKCLEEKVMDLNAALKDKNHTISNLNMIIKVQSARIEGFMKDNAHHLEQNLKLNQLLEASTKKIEPEQKTSHYIQKSINTFLTKPQPTALSLPSRNQAFFDMISSSRSKRTKRSIDEIFSRESSPKSYKKFTTYSSTPEQGRDSSPVTERPVISSPELGDSPNSCINIEAEEEKDEILFDVSFSPREQPPLSSPEKTERPLVYLDESTFEDSQPRLRSMSPSDKTLSPLETISELKHEDTNENNNKCHPPLETISELKHEDTNENKNKCHPPLRRPSSDIQRRIAELDNAQKRTSQENTSSSLIERKSSYNDENQVPSPAGLKKEIATSHPKVPLANATNMKITAPQNTAGQPSKENKINRKALATKENHTDCKEATCVGCEKVVIIEIDEKYGYKVIIITFYIYIHIYSFMEQSLYKM